MNIPDDAKSETECLIELVKQRYGDRMDSGQMKDVTKTIQSIRKMADALKSVHLKNSDEPFTQFTPYRDQD
jgi:hypothetical protein